jgi:hypothetical protein
MPRSDYAAIGPAPTHQLLAPRRLLRRELVRALSPLWRDRPAAHTLDQRPHGGPRIGHDAYLDRMRASRGITRWR